MRLSCLVLSCLVMECLASYALPLITVGGYMANQFHVAFSGDVQGAAIFAGGPFYCARNNLNTALVTW